MVEAEAVLGDKAYDAQERVIGPLTERGIEVVIPPKKNRKELRNYDEILYKARHLIENFFAKLKQYRAIATRYDKRFVYPSLYEGCGILLLEAISLDCPIACSYTSSLPDSEQIYMIFCGKNQK